MEVKKTERKRKRFVARLLSSKGIKCKDNPSTNIIICNAGQATGLEKADIDKLIEISRLDVGPPKLIAERGETYSYLVFNNIDDATQFYTVLNGNGNTNQKVGVLYMSYVEEVPNTEIIIQHENPKGLQLLDEFITVEEEEMFLKLFDRSEETGTLKNRQVRHYGYAFRYGSNDVDLTRPLADKLPPECDVLWSRLEQRGYQLGVPDQLTVNMYRPGQGIPMHVDQHSPFGDTVLSLSLGSDVLMDWRHQSGAHLPLLVPARSLLVMQDEARYAWQHGISPRACDPRVVAGRACDPREVAGRACDPREVAGRACDPREVAGRACDPREVAGRACDPREVAGRACDPREVAGRACDPREVAGRVLCAERVPRARRVSLTFRWTRTGPCRCMFPALCDRGAAPELQDALAARLEELHVHQVYEQIARHFSSTRRAPWPAVERFMSGVAPGSVLLDLGAGNGKNILPRSDILQVAGERSWALCEEARRHVLGLRGAGPADCARLDLLQAPLREARADVLLCVAVLHHFSSQSRRVEAVSMMHRLLRAGGRAFITVWARDQARSNYLRSGGRQTTGEVTVTVAGVQLPLHQNRTQFKHKDLLVPWKLKSPTDNKLPDMSESTLLRYYHVFDEKELDELCTTVGFHVETSFYEEGNWCVVCVKK